MTPSSARNTQTRTHWRRVLPLLTLLATVGLALVITAPAALAGEASPPAAHGYVVYSNAAGGLTCATGRPTSASFGFNYDASHLASGPYHLVVDYETFDTTNNHPSQGPFDTATVPVTPGHGLATYSQTISLAGHTNGENEIFMSAHLVGSSDDSYEFVSRSLGLTCPAAPPRTLTAPTASFSPISCKGTTTVAFDGTHANYEAQWIILGVTGGFSVAPPTEYIAPGQIRRVSLTDFAPGDTVEIQMNATSGAGRLDIGRYTLTAARCPKVTLSPSSAAPGATIHVTGTGYQPGETVAGSLHTTPINLGNHTANSSGAVNFAFTVPANLAPGSHTVTLTGHPSGLTASATLHVTASGSNGTPGGAPSSNAPLANTGNGPISHLLAIAAGLLGLGLLLSAAGRKARR